MPSVPPTLCSTLAALLATLVMVHSAMPLRGAAPPAEKDNPDKARVRTILTSTQIPDGANRKFLEDWVRAQLTEMWAVVDSPQLPALSATEDLRLSAKPVKVDRIEYREGFVDGIAQIYAGLVVGMVTNTAKPPASEMAYVSAVGLLADFRSKAIIADLIKMGRVATLPPAARSRLYWAFQDKEMADQIAKGPESDNLKKWLVELGSRETDTVAARELYAAADFRSVGGDEPAAVKLTLEIMKARLANYYAGRNGGLGAESRGIETLERARLANENFLSDRDALNTVLDVAGRCLYVHGVRYTEFNKTNHDVLKARRVPVNNLRVAILETVVLSERMAAAALEAAGVKAGRGDLERAFGSHVNKYPLATTAYGPDNILEFEEFIKALEARRAAIKKVLSDRKAPGDIPDAPPWRESFDSSATR